MRRYPAILILAATTSVAVACGGNGAPPPPKAAVVTVPSSTPSAEPAATFEPVVVNHQTIASTEPAPLSKEEEEPEADPHASDTPPQGDTCGLRARLRSLPSTDGFNHYALTITNNGKKRVRLVVPGDGSDAGWRTPILTWIGTANGKPAKHAVIGRCGMMNPVQANEIFELAPGQSREIKDWLGFPMFVPGTYEVSLRFRNDPGLASRKAGMTPAVEQQLLATSTCDVTTNTVVSTIK